MGLLVRWAIGFLAVLATGYVAQLLPYQFFTYSDIGAAAVFSLVLGLVNAFIRPIAKLLALPITCLTLGLFTLVVNGLMFLLAAWISGLVVGESVQVAGVLGAMIAAVVVSLFSTILSRAVDA